MKKKILYIAAIIICLSVITSGTFAYYTKNATARNVITSDAVDVEIIQEQTRTAQTNTTQTIKVMPTVKISKTVAARSNAQPAWIRMRYVVTVLDESGAAVQIPADQLKKAILITPNETNWELKDGWWYYKTAIGSRATTTPLFEQIEFSGPEMGNEYQGTTLNLDIYLQAVQQVHNGDTVWEALGWPEN